MSNGTITFCTGDTPDVSSSCDLAPDVSAIPAGPPGVPGAAGGADGADGSDGAPAYSSLTAAFTQPAVNGTVSVSLVTTAWLVVNLPVFAASGGTYRVVSITNDTTAVLRNLGYSSNASPGSTVPSGGLVVPTGLEGSGSGSSDSSVLSTTTETALGLLTVSVSDVGLLRGFYNEDTAQMEWWRLEDTGDWASETTVAGQTRLVHDWDADDKPIGWRRVG